MAAPYLDDMVHINGLPLAWVCPIDYNIGGDTLIVHDTDTTKRARFINTTSTTIGFVRPESTSAAAEYLEITTGDGTIIRFDKTKTILDKTGAVISDTTSGDSTVKGKISFTAAQGDYDSGAATDKYIAYLNKLKAIHASECLVCVPVGHVASGDKTATPGYAFIIGTLDADASHASAAYANAPVTLSFTSKSINIGTLDPTEGVAEAGTPGTPTSPANSLTLGGQLLPRSLSSGTPAGVTYTPPALTIAELQKLCAGEIIFKKSA